MNSKPTYLFQVVKLPFKSVDKLIGIKIITLAQHMPTSMERVSKMTTLSLSLYHLLLHEQILLATMHCESENKENSETFWNCWNEALSSALEERYMFNPAGLMLHEEGSNWNAIKNVFGCEFMERCISCKFHFKESVNPKMKDSYVYKFKRS